MRGRLGAGLGLLLAIILLTGSYAYDLSKEPRSYEGYCAGFEPPIRECNLPEYLVQLAVITLLASSFTSRLLAWGILMTALPLPIIGHQLGGCLDLRDSR